MSPEHYLAKAHELAKQRGGRCLSKKYINARAKLIWECGKCNFQWAASPEHVRSTKTKKGSWCPKCAGKQKTIEDMRLYAQSRGGYCLSKKYYTVHKKLLWKCAKGHVWNSSPASTFTGKKWCPFCGGTKKLDISFAKKIAIQRGGICLSTDYKRAKERLNWRCHNGHEFSTSYANVKSGGWCPTCSGYTGEEITRLHFEKIFGEKFPKVRNLHWLRSNEGTSLELDGYCKKLSIAFEHQGRQHSEEIGFFTTKMSLKRRKEYDKLKVKLCKKHGIKLFLIPQVLTDIQPANLKSLILSLAKQFRLKISPNSATLKINYQPAYKKNPIPELKALAKERRGQLLSRKYEGIKAKYEWKCNEGHIWKAVYSSIKYGYWCPKCAGNEKSSIEAMQLLAKKKGGVCLSPHYENTDRHIEWQCKFGHKFNMTPSAVKRNQWCPHCSGRYSLSIEKAREVAKRNGGKCLSKIYVNNSQKLLFLCKAGHKFKASYANVAGNKGKTGTWCPRCFSARRSQDQKLTIEEMQKIAHKKKGKCLSKKYINATTHLRWKCSRGHTWWAVPSSVKAGRWCRKCYELRVS